MMSEGSEDDSSDVNGASEEWDDDVDVEGDGHPDPLPSRNWGLGMNVDVDIEMDASIEVDGRTRRVKKRKVRKKSTLEDPTHVNGGKDASAGASASTLKPRAEKVIDLGPLVGVKRGFRTREKAPMNGGWGGVELVPSSLKAFPEVRAEEDPHVGDKGKGKMRAADGEWFRGGAHWCLSFFFASLLAFGWSLVTDDFYHGRQTKTIQMLALQWPRYPHGCARLGHDLQRVNRNHRKKIHREITQHV